MTPAERLARIEKKVDEVHDFERSQVALLGQIVEAMESWRDHDRANDRLGERLDAVEQRRGLTRPGPNLHLVRE